jgi:hypothetical protein
VIDNVIFDIFADAVCEFAGFVGAVAISAVAASIECGR